MNNRFEYSIIEAINNAIKTVKASPLVLGSTASGFGGPTGGYVGYLTQGRVSYDPLEVASSGTPASGMSLIDNLNHVRYRLDILESGTFLDLDDTPNSYSGYAGKAVVVNPTEDGLEFKPYISGITVLHEGVEVAQDITKLDFYGAAVAYSGVTATITSNIVPYVSKSGDYTILRNDYVVDVVANSVNITAPTASGTMGELHVVKNSGTGIVTMITISGQLIDESESGTFTLSQWESITIVSDNNNWKVI